MPLLLALYGAYLLWKKGTAKRIGDPRLVKELYKAHSPLKATVKFFLVLISFSLGCLALANPRRPDSTENEVRKGIDVLIALDISNSMLATDVSPNRLQQARAFIEKAMAAMPNDRIGLVVFAGHAYVQLPLTFDHGAAQMFVTTADPASIAAQGTAIGDALEKCNLAFGQESGKYKSIILITDGETHDEAALINAQNLAQKGVMINTVGIGSPGGATILDTATGSAKKDASGHIIITKLNEELLRQIAAATGGRYIHLQNTSSAVAQVQQQVAGIEKTALGDTSLFTYKTFYAWFALPMLLLLLVEIFFPDRKKGTA